MKSCLNQYLSSEQGDESSPSSPTENKREQTEKWESAASSCMSVNGWVSKSRHAAFFSWHVNV